VEKVLKIIKASVRRRGFKKQIH